MITIPDCLQKATRMDLPAGTYVFKPGDICENFFFLVEGSIRVDMLTAEGNEILLYRFGAGETCLLTSSCLLSKDRYCASALVEVDSTACVLDAALFHSEIVSNEAFRMLVFRHFAIRLSTLIQKVDEVAFKSLDSRLAKRVLELTDHASLRLDVTHEQLAKDLGSAREVISRKLAHWEKRAWIARGRGCIHVINLQAIQALV